MLLNDVNSGLDHGMYVWRDPRRNGYPINVSDVEPMLEFAKRVGVKRILYDNWGTGLTSEKSGWDMGSGRQSDEFLDSLISNAHNENILIEALYTDNNRFQEITRFNKKNKNKFDAARMNYEGPWNLGPSSHSNGKSYEPVSTGDIEYFEMSKKKLGSKGKPTIPGWVKNIAKWWSTGDTGDSEFVNAVQYLIRDRVIEVQSGSKPNSGNSVIPDWIKKNAGWWADGNIDDDSFLQGIQFLIKEGIIQVPSVLASASDTIPLYASISWHWGRTDVDDPDSSIKYNDVEKYAFEHILEITDGVDIQTAWGGTNAVDSILFRVSPIVEYARKINKPAWLTIETSDQAPPNQTFADEGQAELESTMQTLLSALKAQNNSPAGIIYHFYMNSYGLT